MTNPFSQAAITKVLLPNQIGKRVFVHDRTAHLIPNPYEYNNIAGKIAAW